MKKGHKLVAIILAAGSGSRYKDAQGMPKQFVPLAGKPLVNYSLETFASSPKVSSLIVVIPSASQDFFAEKIHKTLSNTVKDKLDKPVIGGDTRWTSAANGLDALNDISDEDCLVAIHDAARPFVSLQLIDKCISAAAANDGSALAMPITDTLGFAPEGNSSARYLKDTPPRSAYYAMQTPQIFRASLLRKAYAWVKQQTNPQNFTDDCSIILAYNKLLKIAIVEGSSDNMKLTYSADSHGLEAILKNHSSCNCNS
ncbi:MAG: 2-C-methyl-D-erythritol 4-phosphate cytidylyltransferase [Candidatus Portiera sp.]|nr:2-C-methyl-D-erythritol 4-phosphate cytidylyltransferase [Portiera sp.]